MPHTSVSIRVQGRRELHSLAIHLKAAGNPKDISRDMRKNFREAARPVILEMRAAVMAVDVASTKGGVARPDKSTALRARTGAALRLSMAARGGVRIYISGAAIGPYGNTLALYLDSEIARFTLWRHPVFGNKKNWVSQMGQPWFYVTARKNYRRFQSGVLDAIDKTLEKLK